MDDLTIIRAGAPAEPLPTAAELAPARARLLATLRTADPVAAPGEAPGRTPGQAPGQAQPGDRVVGSARASAGSRAAGRSVRADSAVPAGSGAARREGRRSRTRYAALGGITVAVAAGIAAALVLAPAATLAPNRPPAAQADAATILARASATAAARPDLVPRANQYLYVRTVGDGPASQVWSSVDGTRDGLIRMQGRPDVPVPGCRNGRQTTYKGDQAIGTEGCSARPAYDPAVPTSAAAMPAYLKRVWTVDGTDINAFGKAVLGMSQTNWLRPRQQAALFTAAGRMPGMVAYPDIADGAGRHGVGVGWGTTAGGRVVLVFDKTSYDYLGLVFYRPGSQQPTARTATTAYRIVDRVGRTS